MTFRNGFSIVELMVALLLGSLIAIAATQLFLVNRQATNLQLGISSVQDQGRFALDYMTRDLMQAGHDSTGVAVQPFIFTGDTEEISKDDPKYDSIAFQVHNGFDCLGNISYSGVKIYSVAVANKGLRCSYTSSTGRQVSGTIIDGVEAFQVQYGIDYDKSGEAGFGQADVYTDATGASSLISAASKKRIVSARFALLLSSAGIVSTDAAALPASSIDVLDKKYEAGTGDSNVNLRDGRLYRVFSNTVSIRNQVDQI